MPADESIPLSAVVMVTETVAEAHRELLREGLSRVAGELVGKSEPVIRARLLQVATFLHEEMRAGVMRSLHEAADNPTARREPAHN